MFKFLLYLFIIYFLYKLVFGRMMGGMIKTKVYRFDKHHHYHNTPSQDDNQGTVTVNPKINKQKTGRNTPNIGEYVDYEEVK